MAAATEQGITQAHEARPVALPQLVKSYPTLNVALYHAGPAAGRVWYLARAYDEAGRGWLFVEELRALLTDEASPWRVYTWRRLRQLLGQGERLGLWQRDELGRLWLHGPAKVANELGCGRLRGRPVYLPTSGLLEGIALVRAHFYASYEDGRPEPAPMSRAALQSLTGIPERTQREYDELLGRESQINIVVTDEAYTQAARQEAAYERGHALCFVDWTGRRGGDERAEYLALRLPSTRERCLSQAPKGRQRKHNARINLVTNPALGNAANVVQVYHSGAEAAAAAFNRNPEHVHYYPEARALRPTAATPARLVGAQLWGQLCMA